MDWSQRRECAAFGFCGELSGPTRHGQKSKADPAIRGHSRERARRGPPIPRRPAATRNRQVVPAQMQAFQTFNAMFRIDRCHAKRKTVKILG